MAFYPHHHHLQNHHQTPTTNSCCCQPPPCHPPPPQQPPPPPYVTTDPFIMAAIVSQLLQIPTQNPQTPLNFYSHPTNPTNLNPKQTYPHRETDQFHLHNPHSIFHSLIQRIDALEASLNRISSSSCFSLRDAAARTIQTHFRVYLVRRSRTLRQLKDLASIKSNVSFLKSSLSRHGFVDFDSLSRKATDLLVHLDSIQSGDQMIRDSKRSITREIVQFLEMVDSVFVKKNQVLTNTMKNMRFVRNGYRTAHDGSKRSSERGVRSKPQNTGINEKKLIAANLRERVERIGRMSKALEDEDVDDAETELFEHDVDDKDGDIIGLTNNNPLQKNSMHANAKKHVCFMEDGNVVKVYDIDGDIRRTFGDIDEIEDSSKGSRQEEEEVERDDEQSSQRSGDGKKRASYEDGESRYYQDEEFTFDAPEPVKMEARAELMSRKLKSGVKVVG